MFTRIAALMVILAAAHFRLAEAGALDAANAVRREGCDQRRGVAQPLRRSAALDRVAAKWSRGGRLQSAEDAEKSRTRKSVAVKLPAAWDDWKLAASLRANQCQELTDPDFRDVGLFVGPDAFWVILAAPYTVPDAASAPRVAAEILSLVNQARRVARRCGNESFDAVQPLRTSSLLADAATAHARDMAQHNFLSHGGSDGSQPAQRAQSAGYHWLMVGENVAGGPGSAKEVVDGWLASPAHCHNIMQRDFSEMGVGYATDPDSRLFIYWAQMFGRPR
jgi:uncharacterized protein YkwD